MKGKKISGTALQLDIAWRRAAVEMHFLEFCPDEEGEIELSCHVDSAFNIFFFFRCAYILRASVSIIDSPFIGLPIAYVVLWTAQTAASFNVTTVAKIMLLFCGTVLSVVMLSVRGLLEILLFFLFIVKSLWKTKNVTAKWHNVPSISYEVVEQFVDIIMWNIQ